ncbi:MAG: hypothetical protein GC204_02515 [Chloroflexi bacterium]|nr:hypothetical protein [Chloroflexota bacterium]
MRIVFIVIIGIILLLAVSVSAQERALDPSANPDHGIVAGGIGFQPDPFRVEKVMGGGEVDASQRNLGADCSGHITVQPAFRFTALDPLDVLRFIFVADAVTADGSLIVVDPRGNFHCNNDSYGVRNPTVEIDGALAGDYNVWVGALTDRVSGSLYVTTRTDITPGSIGLNIPRTTPVPTLAPTSTPIPADVLNPTLISIYGAESLTAGFLPDPYSRVVIAGGALDVQKSVTDDDNCAGYTTNAPSFRVNWAGQSTRLRFLFAPLDDNQDAALIVQGADGSWVCNRDFAGGYNRPQAEFINPVAGDYNIWVSSETAPAEQIIGVLYVTEKQWSPETVPSAVTAPTDPITGLTPATSAFAFDAAAPDPYIIPGSLGGGDIDVGAQNKACPGSYESQPSFGFILPQPTPFLRIFFVSTEPKADAALIVRMPDGTWYCNDDSFNSKQPTVDVIGNFSTGGVSVWIGSLDATTIPGTLYLTHGGANPRNPTRPPPIILHQ